MGEVGRRRGGGLGLGGVVVGVDVDGVVITFIGLLHVAG